MLRLVRSLLVSMCLAAFGAGAANDPPTDAGKVALQSLNEFVGNWNGAGGPDKPRPGPNDPTWNEKIQWSWSFKGDDAWLSFEIKDGRFFRNGTVRYLPDRKLYKLFATDAKAQKLEFEGRLDNKGYLVFERTDGVTGELQQLTMNLAADGVRFVYHYATKAKGITLFTKVFLVAATREGESLGIGAKKNECVVTGGLGMIPVTYMGETYYVCCTGCRDAFNWDPEKTIRDFKAKKRGP